MSRPTSTNASVVAIAIAAGALCALAGPQPVESSAASAVIVLLAVAAVCSIGALAPRRLLSWAALLAGVTSLWPPGMVLGFAIFVLGYLSTTTGCAGARLSWTRGRAAPVVNAAVSGVAMNVAARSDADAFFGAASIVAGAIGVLIITGGLSNMQRRPRRIAVAAAAGIALVLVGASAAFTVFAVRASDDVSQGKQLVREGLRHLSDADVEAAQISFEDANAHFTDAESRLDSPVTSVAAAIPVLSQNRSAALAVSHEAITVTSLLSSVLNELGPDGLTLVDSRVDVDNLARFAEALSDVQVAVDDLQAKVDGISSPWLFGAVTERLVEFSDEITEQRTSLDTGVDVMANVPEFLGADGERVYLLMFTTPAEARGLGGFTGNYAEITVDDGHVELSRFGRTDELDAAGAGARTISSPADWLARYGQYGFVEEPGGTVGAQPFKNVTMSPLMSSTGEVISQLYEQSGGRPVDGVFAADVYVLAELLRFSGPVRVSGTNQKINKNNAVEFLLNGQYALPEKDERIDLIEEASRAVVDRLLAGTSLTPKELIKALGPMVEEGRLAGWAPEADEQAFLERRGLAGTLLHRTTDDAVTVAFNNAAANKIDYFLETSGGYRADVDLEAGTVEGVYEVTLVNNAPTERQPRYVIGNAIKEPLGTNRTYVSIFTALPPTGLTIDGVEVDAESGFEAGYYVTSAFVLIPSGESRTLVVEVSGSFDTTDGYTLLVRSPPAVGSTPISVDLDIVDAAGTATVSEFVDTAGVERFDITSTVLAGP